MVSVNSLTRTKANRCGSMPKLCRRLIASETGSRKIRSSADSTWSHPRKLVPQVMQPAEKLAAIRFDWLLSRHFVLTMNAGPYNKRVIPSMARRQDSVEKSSRPRAHNLRSCNRRPRTKASGRMPGLSEVSKWFWDLGTLLRIVAPGY